MDTAETNEPVHQTTSAEERLLTLRLLISRKQRLDNQMKAVKAKWRDILDEKTRAISALIDPEVPVDPDMALPRLIELRDTWKSRQHAETEKAAEVSKVKAQIEKTEATWYEVLMTSNSAEQLPLPSGLGASDPWITADVASTVNEELASLQSAGAEFSPDMESLRARLDAIGVGSIRLVPSEVASTDDEAGDDDTANVH